MRGVSGLILRRELELEMRMDLECGHVTTNGQGSSDMSYAALMFSR